jgi:zinc/manganese transport system permease protein
VVTADPGVGAGQAGSGGLADLISLGVLASSVPREVIDEAVAAHGRQAKRSGGKLPPHVMVYFAMATALFADDDYAEIMVRLSGALASWGCWDEEWVMPTTGGITQARARLGPEPMAEIFEQVAVPVAELLTRGAWLGSWRLMAIDGLGQHIASAPRGHLYVRPGVFMAAADSFRITVHGRGGHGSTPQNTVDPIVIAASIVLRLQTIVSREIAADDAAVVTVGAIHAGSKENIIPAEAELKLNVRTFDPDVRRRVLAAVERIVTAEGGGGGGARPPPPDSVIGVVLAFGLGLGVLMLALYPGRASNKFGLLTGSIVSVDATNLAVLGGVAALVVAVLAVVYRPLLFASADPEVALARGVPVRLLSLVFAVLIGLVTALAVPVVGAILVLAVMIAPGAAAARVTANPLRATLLAVAFAELALVGGTVLSLAPGLPVSGYVAAIAFACYVACRIIGRTRGRAPARA